MQIFRWYETPSEFLLDSEKIKEVLTSTLSLSDEPQGDPGLVNSFFFGVFKSFYKR